MAQSKSFFGLRRGSTKSHTYQVYRGKQITKDRVESVANPQTESQMRQRIKLAQLSCARSVLKGLVDHSFEGVSYGRESLAYFVSENLGKDGMSRIQAWIPKGMGDPGNADYLISKGSLDQISYALDDATAGNSLNSEELGMPLTSGDITTSIKEGDTIDEAWQNLLNKVLGIDADSQLTFLISYLGLPFTYNINAETTGKTQYHRFVISRFMGDLSKQSGVWKAAEDYTGVTVSGTQQAGNLLLTDGYVDVQIALDSAKVQIQPVNSKISAAGCIIKSAYVDSTWKRSTAYLAIAPNIDKLGLNDSYADVVNTYLKDTTASTKYLNTGVEGVGIEGSPSTSSSEN